MPSLRPAPRLLRSLPSSAVPISFSSSVNCLSWVSPSQGAGVDYAVFAILVDDEVPGAGFPGSVDMVRMVSPRYEAAR